MDELLPYLPPSDSSQVQLVGCRQCMPQDQNLSTALHLHHVNEGRHVLLLWLLIKERQGISVSMQLYGVLAQKFKSMQLYGELAQRLTIIW